MVNADKKRVGNEAEDVSTNGTATTQDVDMKAPNRNNFEHNLSKLNNASSNVQTQVDLRFKFLELDDSSSWISYSSISIICICFS